MNPFLSGGIEILVNATGIGHSRIFTFNPFGIDRRQDACTTKIGWIPASAGMTYFGRMTFDSPRIGK